MTEEQVSRISTALQQFDQGEEARKEDELDRALPCFMEARSIWRLLVDECPDQDLYAVRLAVSELRVGEVLMMQGSDEEALECFHASLKAAQECLADSGVQRFGVASCQEYMGQLLQRRGDLDGAIKSFRKSLAAWRSLERDGEETGVHVAACLLTIGSVLHAQGAWDSGLATVREAQADMEMKVAADPANPSFLSFLVVTVDKVGQMLSAQGDKAGARACLLRCVKLTRSMIAVAPWDVDARMRLGVALGVAGRHLRDHGRPGDALALFEESATTWRNLSTMYPGEERIQQRLSTALDDLAGARVALKDFAGSLQCHQESLEIQLALMRARMRGTQRQWECVAVAYDSIGDLLLGLGDSASALQHHEKAVPIWKLLVAEYPADHGLQRRLAWTRDRCDGLKEVLQRKTHEPAPDDPTNLH